MDSRLRGNGRGGYYMKNEQFNVCASIVLTNVNAYVYGNGNESERKQEESSACGG